MHARHLQLWIWPPTAVCLEFADFWQKFPKSFTHFLFSQTKERHKLEALKKKQEQEEERMKKMEEEKKKKQDELKRLTLHLLIHSD